LIGAAQAAGPPVTVRVCVQEGKLVLCVEDSGPSVDADRVDEALEPFGQARAGEKSLERAAWLSIARRLKAKLRASSAPGKGLAIAVEFSPAA
jgi:signal transduction histidine kinase